MSFPVGWVIEDVDHHITFDTDWNKELQVLDKFLLTDNLSIVHEGKQMDDMVHRRLMNERMDRAANDVDTKALPIFSEVVQEYPEAIQTIITRFKKEFMVCPSRQHLQTLCYKLLRSHIDPTLICVAMSNMIYDYRLPSEKMKKKKEGIPKSKNTKEKSRTKKSQQKKQKAVTVNGLPVIS